MAGVNDTMREAVLRNLIESEKLLRLAAEVEAQATRKALESLAKDLAKEMVDVLAKQHNQGLAGIAPDILAERIRQAVRSKIARLQTSASLAPSAPAPLPTASSPDIEHQHWQQTIAENEQTIAENEAEINRLQEELARLQAKASLPQGKKSIVPSTETSAITVEAKALSRNDEDAPLPIEDFVPYSADFLPAAAKEVWPDWFRSWVSPHAGLDKDYTLIQILGKTGEPYRATVTQAAAYYLGMTSVGGSLGKSVIRLEEMEMVTLVKIRWQRINPHLVALTDRGKDTYRMLFGQDPVPQELPRLLARHKSALHTYLILETDQYLRAAGYAVERYPDPIETDLGRYEPDLVARFDEQTLYIEAEIKTSKSRGKNSDRRRKWERYWKLTGGEFYVSVMDTAGRRSLLSELRYWASILEQKAVVWLLEAGNRRWEKTVGWNIWERIDIG